MTGMNMCTATLTRNA